MKAKQWFALLLMLAFLLLLSHQRSNAQSFTRTILGTLKDATGAVVLQATVLRENSRGAPADAQASGPRLGGLFRKTGNAETRPLH